MQGQMLLSNRALKMITGASFIGGARPGRQSVCISVGFTALAQVVGISFATSTPAALADCDILLAGSAATFIQLHRRDWGCMIDNAVGIFTTAALNVAMVESFWSPSREGDPWIP